MQYLSTPIATIKLLHLQVGATWCTGTCVKPQRLKDKMKVEGQLIQSCDNMGNLHSVSRKSKFVVVHGTGRVYIVITVSTHSRLTNW